MLRVDGALDPGDRVVERGPAGRLCQATPAKRSTPRVAKRREISSCWAPKMFTQKRPLWRILGQVVELFAGQNRISGGSSETEVTEFADIATGPSAWCAVITVTPVGRCPSTWRKRSLSKLSGVVIAQERICAGACRRPRSDLELLVGCPCTTMTSRLAPRGPPEQVARDMFARRRVADPAA